LGPLSERNLNFSTGDFHSDRAIVASQFIIVTMSNLGNFHNFGNFGNFEFSKEIQKDRL
jgi:hypothetical protein